MKTETSIEKRTPKPATMAAWVKNQGLTRSAGIMTNHIKAIVPSHVTADRLAMVALQAVNHNHKLGLCSPESVFEGVEHAAKLGFEINDGTSRAFLIPYRVKGQYQAQFQIGYQGLLELVWRSGFIETISAHPVFEGDEFEFCLGLRPNIAHVPGGELDAAKMTHVYAVVHFKGGGYQLEVMTRRQVDAIRSRSKASSSGPWVTDYVEMARKTVLRRVCKYVPKSSEMAMAMAQDERAEYVVDVQAEPKDDELPNGYTVDGEGEVVSTEELAERELIKE